MKYPEFKLETYLATHEFSAPFNLCASDLETFSMQEIIQMSDPSTRSLWENLKLGYTETEGHPLLREAISLDYGNNIKKKHILCFAGAEEGIYCMAHTLLDKEDHAIVITPCYQSLKSLPASICSLTEISLKYEDSWNLDLQKIENAIQKNTKLLLINFPHNPTGALISHEVQKELIKLAKKHDLWVFSDEVYRFLELNPVDRLPPIAGVYEKGISLSVMSKAYGLSGLRVGWIACQNTNILSKMNQTKHYLSICNSAPSEILALMALQVSAKIHERNHFLMHRNLKLLNQFFEEYSEWFEWVQPKGGCIGYPKFHGSISSDELASQLIKHSGVLLLPGSIYEHLPQFFRISFGRKSMPKVLEKLKLFIDASKNKWRKV